MSKQFWLLTNSDRHEPAEWEYSKNRLESVTCPVFPGHLRPGRRLTELFVLLSQTPVPDFVWTWVSDLLVRSSVLAFLREHALSGFAARKAHASFKNRATTPPTLYEFQVVGWGGMASMESGIQMVDKCDACGYLQYTVTDPTKLLDESQWDGSDFFMVWPLPRYIFISDRAASLLRSARFSGATILPASRTPIKRGNTLSPGRLSHWMPERRAHEIGGPLGIV